MTEQEQWPTDQLQIRKAATYAKIQATRPAKLQARMDADDAMVESFDARKPGNDAGCAAWDCGISVGRVRAARKRIEVKKSKNSLRYTKTRRMVRIDAERAANDA